jgi:Domain of unknown function (DUF397)
VTGPVWLKSSRCVGGECVEVAAEAGAVHVRDSAGRQITVTPTVWAAFLAAVRAGHYDQDPL